MPKGIIGAGNWILDKVKLIDRWPGETELCNISEQTVGGGGGPCNVLFDIAAMKCDIPLYACGVLGNDAEGTYLMEQIKAKGIDGRHMCHSDSQPTSFTDVMTVKNTGRRTFFHARGANAEFGFKHIESMDIDAKIFYLGYLLLLDEFDQKDAEYGTVAARVLDHMSKKGCLTIVDVVSEDSRKFNEIVPPSLKYIDCLVINETEAGCCSGMAVRSESGEINLDALIASGNHLLENGVRKFVVIHFPEGAVVIEKDGTIQTMESCHLERSDIVGTVGAGDAFCAGIVYGLHEGLSIDESLRLASASAWFNLQSPTASEGAPTMEAMRDCLKSQDLKPL